MEYIIIIITGLIVIFVLLYNKVVKQNIRCKNAFASIDNQLKRRSDLIPNLVNVTKGYMKYEAETLEKIVKIRTDNLSELAKTSNEISNNIKLMLAKAESYPDLKADEVFKKLQVELTGTEDKIAFARQFYNDCVQKYNTVIETFPTNIIANIFKYNKKEYFKITDEDRKEVNIKI
ncbi:MAG: LemA family protein [Firmicutes bacterium]|nr:LemA family protein [Bacillota bacterium]